MGKRILALLTALLLLTLTVAAESKQAENSPATEIINILSGGSTAEQEALWQSMTPEMQQALTPEALSALWEQLSAPFGEYLGMAGDSGISQASGMTVYACPLDFALAKVTVCVVVDGEGRLAGLQIAAAESKAAPAAAETGENIFTEEEVSFGTEPWVMKGTVTLPLDAKTPVPAVVLVQGSGASDRDEKAYSLTPFRDIAHGLAKRGIASIRFDKRTYVYGSTIAQSPDYATFTVEEEIIQDAILAGKVLSQDARIDANRLYVLGHSLGAMLAPRIAEESDGLFGGMILACGSNLSLREIMLRQMEDQKGSPLTPEEIEQAIQPAFYFEEMEAHDSPAEYMQRLRLPALLMNGSRDFQINPEEGQGSWEKALPMDADWLTCFWTDVNHMLMKPDVDEAQQGTAAEYMVPCHVDESVLDEIATFVMNP